MTVLVGKLNTHKVPVLAASLALLTIGLCYYIAVSLGHVQPFPKTDITHCAIGVPERYLFRIGMIPSCCLIIYVWYLAREWVRGEEKIMAPAKGSSATTCTSSSSRSKEGVAAALGTIGAMLLIVASSVIEEGQMPWTIHIIGATGFFIFTGIAQLILTTKLYQLSTQNSQVLSNGSLNWKISCVGGVLLVAIGEAVVEILMLTGRLGPNNWGNAFEWMLVAFVIGYFVSFSWDWDGRTYQTIVVADLPPESPERATAANV